MNRLFDCLYDDSFIEKLENKKSLQLVNSFVAKPFFTLMLFLLPYFAKEVGEKDFNKFLFFMQFFIFCFCMKLLFSKEHDYKKDLKEEIFSSIITIIGIFILLKLKIIGIYSEEIDSSFQTIAYTIGYLGPITLMIFFYYDIYAKGKMLGKRFKIMLFATMIGNLLSALFLYIVSKSEVSISYVNIITTLIIVFVIYFFNYKSYKYYFNKNKKE